MVIVRFLLSRITSHIGHARHRSSVTADRRISPAVALDVGYAEADHLLAAAGTGRTWTTRHGFIGGRVRYWHKRRNLSRQWFADLVGRSASWVDKIENGGRSLLRLPMLERVADALHADPAAAASEPMPSWS
ncbi:MAG: helix-turn-helix domain-containing protein [Pseudonocardiales bacterium]